MLQHAKQRGVSVYRIYSTCYACCQLPPLLQLYKGTLEKHTHVIYLFFVHVLAHLSVCQAQTQQNDTAMKTSVALPWQQMNARAEQNGVEQSRADRSRRIKAQRSSQRGEEERRTLLNTTSSTSSPSWSLQPQLFLSSISVCCQTLQSETRSDGSTLTLAPKKEAY